MNARWKRNKYSKSDLHCTGQLYWAQWRKIELACRSSRLLPLQWGAAWKLHSAKENFNIVGKLKELKAWMSLSLRTWTNRGIFLFWGIASVGEPLYHMCLHRFYNAVLRPHTLSHLMNVPMSILKPFTYSSNWMLLCAQHVISPGKEHGRMEGSWAVIACTNDGSCLVSIASLPRANATDTRCCCLPT